jgi:O-Antigen ligase
MLRIPSSLSPSPVASPVATARPRTSGQSRGRAQSWAERYPVRLPVAFFVVTLLLLVLHQGKIVQLLYPPGAFVIAVMFYRRMPAHYVGFVCWLFFLSPDVRRLVDFTSGTFNDKSMVLIAPMLAVALSGLSLLKNLEALGQRRCAPLVLIVVALFYGFIIGIAQVGLAAALFTLVNWVFPALIGFHLLATWDHYPDYHRVLLKTSVYGGLVMGLYGVIQFVNPPPWEAYWLIHSKMLAAVGQPLPYSMRIWSTMNSTGPFAIAMMYLLVMSFAARGRLRIAMALFAVPALMFTSVRSCWAGLFIGLLYPVAMLDGKSRVRLVGAMLGIGVLCAPVMMVDEISSKLIKRFDTIENISNDNSFQSRAGFYSYLLPLVMGNIAGQGLGTTGNGTKLAEDQATKSGGVVFDSGVMEVALVLGWPGTLLYTSGIVMLIWRAFIASRARPHDRFAMCGVGASISIFASMIMVNTLVSTSGMFFFIGVMMPVIGLRYVRHAAHHSQKSAGATAAAMRDVASAGARVPAVAVPIVTTRRI